MAQVGAREAGERTATTPLKVSAEAKAAVETKAASLIQKADAGGGTVRVERAGGLNAQDLAAMSRQSGREVALYGNTTNARLAIKLASISPNTAV